MTHIINPKLSDRERQIIKGTILGGSSVIKPTGGKNCYLSMRSKNDKWLSYKAAELQSLSSWNPITIEKTNRWHSLCYPIFTEMRNQFYENDHRKITLETLEKAQLMGEAFMVWFGDAADIVDGEVIFNTHVWGASGSEAIAEYFSLLGYNVKIFSERKNYRIRLDHKATLSLVKMVSHTLPIFLHGRVSQLLNTAHQ